MFDSITIKKASNGWIVYWSIKEKMYEEEPETLVFESYEKMISEVSKILNKKD